LGFFSDSLDFRVDGLALAWDEITRSLPRLQSSSSSKPAVNAVDKLEQRGSKAPALKRDHLAFCPSLLPLAIEPSQSIPTPASSS
jgi:hypothetical protein